MAAPVTGTRERAAHHAQSKRQRSGAPPAPKMRRGPASLAVRVSGPFDLRLSLAGAASFLPLDAPPTELATVVAFGSEAAVVTIRQPLRRSGAVLASAAPRAPKEVLERITKWLVWAELDLRPFYRLAAGDPVLEPVVAVLQGLKPLRPTSLFEMAIITITEQQLSLAAAFHIRSRMVEQFGVRRGRLTSFPSAERLAGAAIPELQGCGLSRRKAEYIKDLALAITRQELDFDRLAQCGDEAIREALGAMRGFGEWSVEYMLARGFGRADALPSTDAGLRRVLGHYFAEGTSLAAEELERALAHVRPFRGIAAYYLAVHWRMQRRPAFFQPAGGGDTGAEPA
jgi:DNA-3-methyladenine glycosylase II